MIIVRAPMRISYVGGGSDYKSFYVKSEGNVLGATINQYIYVYGNSLSEVAKENIRFTYRKTESVLTISQLEHPVLRNVLMEMQWSKKINLGTFSELPAGVGLGGSSAFTVGLLKLLKTIEGENLSRQELAELAIKIERENLNEAGGVQDQYHAAFGGLRHYIFTKSGTHISENLATEDFKEYLDARQFLVWVSDPRESSKFAAHTESSLLAKHELGIKMSSLAKEASKEFKNHEEPKVKFEILTKSVRRGWEIKQEFSPEQDIRVDEISKIAMENGASATKLCGAGGSGFVLVLTEPECKQQITSKLGNLAVIFPRLDLLGTVILHQEPN
jgi:D-glycero-alpha-D-manno-heptose-7-phosphate kinase